MTAVDAGDRGTGHGWRGAQQVYWNCEASEIVVQQPPTAQNYAIGCTGNVPKVRGKDKSKARTPGYFESHGTHVEPRSLYLKQLEDRLGASAVENITVAEQRKGSIYQWLKESLAK